MGKSLYLFFNFAIILCSRKICLNKNKVKLIFIKRQSLSKWKRKPQSREKIFVIHIYDIGLIAEQIYNKL